MVENTKRAALREGGLSEWSSEKHGSTPPSTLEGSVDVPSSVDTVMRMENKETDKDLEWEPVRSSLSWAQVAQGNQARLLRRRFLSCRLGSLRLWSCQMRSTRMFVNGELGV